ncbi:MAG: tryptophan--tRNA ligase, partial [Candidatus Aenigmatarchaeota archaeon]
MKEIFIQEKEKRISPFDVDGEEIDYEKLIKEFGVEPIENLKNKKEIENIDFYKRGRIISHRDFDKFLDAIKSGKKVSIVSGLNASGSMHFGHRGAFDLCLELQKKYKIPVFIPISDDEAYVCKKIKNQEEGLKNAELIAKQVAALGFDPKLTKIFIHQKYTKIYNLAIKLSTKYTLSTIKAIYGFKDETNPGLMFYPVIQAADILLPQELYGPHLTLVPVAIDQDPHIRLARDIAEKFGYVKPAALH